MRTEEGVTKIVLSQKCLESFAREGDSPVGERNYSPDVFPSSAGHGKPGMNLSRPRDKAKYLQRPITKKYREGKMKRTPFRGVK